MSRLKRFFSNTEFFLVILVIATLLYTSVNTSIIIYYSQLANDAEQHAIRLLNETTNTIAFVNQHGGFGTHDQLERNYNAVIKLNDTLNQILHEVNSSSNNNVTVNASP